MQEAEMKREMRKTNNLIFSLLVCIIINIALTGGLLVQYNRIAGLLQSIHTAEVANFQLQVLMLKLLGVEVSKPEKKPSETIFKT